MKLFGSGGALAVKAAEQMVCFNHFFPQELRIISKHKEAVDV